MNEICYVFKLERRRNQDAHRYTQKRSCQCKWVDKESYKRNTHVLHILYIFRKPDSQEIGPQCWPQIKNLKTLRFTVSGIKLVTLNAHQIYQIVVSAYHRNFNY